MITGLMATWYERAMLSPLRLRVDRPVNPAIGEGALERIPGAEGWIVTRSWGSGPTVLLLHGWSGSMADMEDFIAPLVARGFRAVAFDAPAHGESDGRRTNLIQCTGALLQVGATQGPVYGAITHSFGGATAALALHRGFAIPRLVMLGAPNSVVEMSDLRARRAGVPPNVVALANRRIASRYDIDWETIATERLIAGHDLPLLVVHDRGDRSVPYEHGVRIARAAARGRLLTTTGLGHDGILWDRGVIQAVADFISTA
jgi:pimeloyl-ACP methyl ester carboxylesterase